ncbi:MAG: hypothetical protein HY355_03295 [Armatimonadetes bacterium]|nr:hypothetical protein [Armatimonadota bacterium]
MALTEHEAFTRLRDVARQVDSALVVDRGSIHWIEPPYPGVSYNLVLGDAHALLFLPAGDIEPPGWEDRLRQRLESARRYLAGFTPHAR